MKKILRAWIVLWMLPAVCVLSWAAEEYESITDKEIAAIEFEDAAEDHGFVAPFASDLKHLDGDRKARFDEWTEKLDGWEPGVEEKIGQRVRNWICLATLGDVGRGEFEAEAPHVIFERLKKEIPKDKLIKAAAWVVLKPEQGKAVTSAPDLGIEGPVDEGAVRDRAVIYAKKMLGRLLGKLPFEER